LPDPMFVAIGAPRGSAQVSLVPSPPWSLGSFWRVAWCAAPLSVPTPPSTSSFMSSNSSFMAPLRC
jgi:hypothetical protein